MKLKIDFHTHTNRSIDGVSSLHDMLEAAKKAGMDAIAITDHNICSTDIVHNEGDILLIPGCEVSTQEGHVLGVFLKENINVSKLWDGKLPSVAEAVKQIHDKGGVAILAHPFEKNLPISSRSHLASILDGVETINARATFKNLEANQMAEEFAQKHHLICTGGSDGHSNKEVGNAYTVVECSDKTLKSIEMAVRLGKTNPTLIKHTPRFRKGVSQVHKALRGQRKAKVFKSILYLIYCIGLDFYFKVRGLIKCL
ncbi:MAG TPA: CehA/McbA family metallohydrolase [Epulopiscium sp.]|nr:CehA/McbA family metallohydrolase [Candidatus Epulonipiscium sp.]